MQVSLIMTYIIELLLLLLFNVRTAKKIAKCNNEYENFVIVAVRDSTLDELGREQDMVLRAGYKQSCVSSLGHMYKFQPLRSFKQFK